MSGLLVAQQLGDVRTAVTEALQFLLQGYGIRTAREAITALYHPDLLTRAVTCHQIRVKRILCGVRIAQDGHLNFILFSWRCGEARQRWGSSSSGDGGNASVGCGAFVAIWRFYVLSS